MDNNNKSPLTEKEAMKKALKRKTRYRAPSLNIGVIIITAILLLMIAVCSVIIISRDDGGEPFASVDTTTADGATVTDAVTTEAPETEQTIILSSEDIYKGDMILVNADYEYKFPEESDVVCVYDNKTSSYKVGDKTVLLSPAAIAPFNKLMDDFCAAADCNDVMIVTGGGYRSEEYQRQLYASRVESQGAEMAAKYVALPGHSEHHTGLAMDLTVYTDSGEGHTLRTYEKCKWLVENFENYGFILRYPENKTDITGIAYESWHYRSVGMPHSLIMKEKGWVHEEYVEYLQNLPEGTALSWNGISSEEVSLDGMHDGDYVVMYVPADEGAQTEIRLPKNRDYTVSGDNVGGFVVTLMPINGGNTND